MRAKLSTWMSPIVLNPPARDCRQSPEPDLTLARGKKLAYIYGIHSGLVRICPRAVWFTSGVPHIDYHYRAGAVLSDLDQTSPPFLTRIPHMPLRLLDLLPPFPLPV